MPTVHEDTIIPSRHPVVPSIAIDQLDIPRVLLQRNGTADAERTLVPLQKFVWNMR